MEDLEIINLLLVEDSEAEQDLIAKIFVDPVVGRYTLNSVVCLREALHMVQLHSIDLVILDLGLPDSTGLKALQEIVNVAPSLPIIVLTGTDDRQLGREAIRCGAQDFLVKGSGAEMLLPRICYYTIERHRAQQEARQSEQFLRSTIDSLSAHVSLVDERGKILLVNEAWRQFAEENSDDPQSLCEGADYFRACERSSMTDKGSALLFIAGVRRVIGREQSYHECEYPCHGPKMERWFRARVTPFKGQRFAGVVITHEDITSEKRAERDLRTSEAHLRLVFDTSPNLLFVKDQQGRYVMANKALAELFSKNPDELIGKTNREISGTHATESVEMHPFTWGDRRVIEKGETIIIEEEPCVDQRGVKHWFRTIKAPIIFPSLPPCILGIAEEITEQRASQAKIRDSELRLRTILDAIHQAIILLDRDMKVIWANQQAIDNARCGYEAIVGSSCRNVWGVQQPCSHCSAQKALSTGKIEVTVQQVADGRTVRVTGCPVFDGDGEITGVVSLSEDISERVSLEQQLRQAQKMQSLGTLAGGIAHDFNNILTAIIGFTELSMDKARASSDLMSDLCEVYRAGIRARDLVHQILTFSRHIDQELKPLDISLIIKEALKLLRATLPTTITIKSAIEDNLGHIMADPTQIHRIIMNLCTNAAHAMEPMGGVLSVGLRQVELEEKDPRCSDELPPGSYLELRLGDTGSGIEPEVLPFIFEPYFTTMKHDVGTGLGLSVVHGIVKEYGGDISVETTPGEKTEFTILLPVEVDEQHLLEQECSLIPPKGQGEHVLVVDDEPGIIKLCTRMLEKSGYAVSSYSDVREALAALTNGSNTFDLLLTDMTMPHMTGTQLTEKVRAANPRLPVVIMSGNEVGFASQFVEIPGVSLINKPISQQVLLTALGELLGKTASRDRVRSSGNYIRDHKR